MTTLISEGALYSQLPNHVLQDREKLGLTSSARSHFLTTFLQSHVSPRLIREGFEDELRYQHKTLSLGNNIVVTRPKDLAKKKTKRTKRLNAKQRKELKLNELKPEEQKFDLFQPLHDLWKDYINSLINFKKVTPKNMQEFEAKLLKADLHGSMVTVTKAKCSSLIGQSGIVLQETKNTFKIITTSDQLKTIPKQNTIFSLTVGEFLVSIYGNNFLFKSADRSIRSFKTKPTIDL